jgi:hypothetical protein
MIKIGTKINNLTIIGRSERQSTNGTIYWICECKCGKLTEVLTHNLTRKKYGTKGCGCSIGKNPKKLKFREAAQRKLFKVYVDSSRRRKMDFTLTTEELIKITSGNCIYCNAEPSQRIWRSSVRKFYGDYYYNGIDRVDNDKGYVISNSVTCCNKCNRSKQSLNLVEFLSHVKSIYEFSCLDKSSPEEIAEKILNQVKT